MKAESEKFIETKYGANDWGVYPPSKRQVAQWLDEFAEAYHEEQIKNQWISVEDRLPKLEIEDGDFTCSKEVIALFGDPGNRWCESVTLKLWYEDDMPDWYYVYDFERVSGQKPTHWMPTPEPPKP